MILTKLTLKNFKKYKTKEFIFDEGLIGIIGKNGAGKSTIFEAILFALYGELKTKGYKEIIKNTSALPKDNVLVEFEFEFENNIYKIKREFRGKNLTPKAEIYKNDELIVTSVKEVNRYIVSLIKMNKSGFLNTLFASQKELTSLSNLNKDDRKKLIRKLLGFDKIDIVEIEIKEIIKRLKGELNLYNNDILLSNEEINYKQKELNNLNLQKDDINKSKIDENYKLEIIKKEIIELKTLISEYDKKAKQKLKHQNKLSLINNDIQNAKNNLNELNNTKKELLIKQVEYEAQKFIKDEYLSLKELLQNQRILRDKYLQKNSLLKTQELLRDRYKELKQKVEILKQEIIKKDNISKNIDLLHHEINSLENQKKELEDKIAGENKLIKDTQNKIKNIEKLGKESACPICTRPLLDEYENVLNSLFAEIQNNYKKNIDDYQLSLNKIIEKLNIKKNEFKKLDNSLAILKSKQEDLKKLKKEFKEVEKQGILNKNKIKNLEVEYDEKYHFKIEEEFKSLEEKYNKLLILENEIKRIENIDKNINIENNKINILQNELLNLQNQKIEYDENKHHNLTKQFEELEIQKDKLLKTINEIEIKLKTNEYKIKEIIKELDKNNEMLKKVEEIQKDILDYEKLKTHLNSFKNKLNSKIAPRISTIASDLFTKITKGRYQHIEISDEFDFYIYDDNQKYPIERFSGGEIDLANLVLRIAISKTLMELNGMSSISFLAFDEVFGSQDEDRRLQILQAFHTIKEQYKQIFLISHEIDIKEMFEKVIEI